MYIEMEFSIKYYVESVTLKLYRREMLIDSIKIRFSTPLTIYKKRKQKFKQRGAADNVCSAYNHNKTNKTDVHLEILRAGLQTKTHSAVSYPLKRWPR